MVMLNPDKLITKINHYIAFGQKCAKASSLWDPCWANPLSFGSH